MKTNFKPVLFLLTTLMVISMPLAACDVCTKQQPKILRGLSHGTGPEGQSDYIIVIIVSLIVLVSLILSIKLLVKPGEKSLDHIKTSILESK